MTLIYTYYGYYGSWSLASELFFRDFLLIIFDWAAELRPPEFQA